MTDAPVTLEILASQLADTVGSLDEANVEVATMASMAVRLDVAVVRLDAAFKTFSREMAQLRRLPAGVISSIGSDDAGAARPPCPRGDVSHADAAGSLGVHRATAPKDLMQK